MTALTTLLVRSTDLNFPTELPPNPWVAVRQRFSKFNDELLLTDTQVADGHTKRNGVVSCLNRHYYASDSETDHSFFIGSWAKGTAIRPPRDVDLYFVLPVEVYTRFLSYTGNRQSALLQEVKGVLQATYPRTDMRGDGQVVMVNFESYNVEVVPAFLLNSGRYWICDTNDGGRYMETDPKTEALHTDTADRSNNGNLRPLVRMLKAWQTQCSVPLKSFQLELLAASFIQQSPWRLNNYFWFDWIVRDFFEYLIGQTHGCVVVPGTYQFIYLGDEWLSRAQTAHNRAVKACEFEKFNFVAEAGEEWQKIFGQQILLSP